MSDPTVVLAFVLGALFNALVGAGVAEFKSRQEHKRAIELDRGTQSRQAAAAILEEVDRIIEFYALKRSGKVTQADVEPSYRVISRRSVELADPPVRKVIDEIADGYFYIVPEAPMFGGSDFTLAYGLRSTARNVLGAVVRGEPFAEVTSLGDLRGVASQVHEMWRDIEGDV